MPVHVIIDIKVINKDIYKEYIQKVPSTVKRFGGRYLARGGKITTLSGDWHPERVTLLEFDNVEQARNWLTSREYAEVAPLREKSTMTNAILIENDPLP